MVDKKREYYIFQPVQSGIIFIIITVLLQGIYSFKKAQAILKIVNIEYSFSLSVERYYASSLS